MVDFTVKVVLHESLLPNWQQSVDEVIFPHLSKKRKKRKSRIKVHDDKTKACTNSNFASVHYPLPSLCKRGKKFQYTQIFITVEDMRPLDTQL